MFNRNDLVLFRCHRPFARAEHERNARSVNIAIAQSNPRLRFLQSNGQVRRDGRFTHSTFAAGHREHMFDSGKSSRTHPARTGPSGWRVNVDQDLCVLNARNSAQELFSIVFDRGRNIRIVCGDSELHAHIAVIDVDRLDQAERDDITTEPGVFNLS